MICCRDVIANRMLETDFHIEPEYDNEAENKKNKTNQTVILHQEILQDHIFSLEKLN